VNAEVTPVPLADIYISIDVEADGPIPGDYSMLSLGAAVAEPPFDRTFYRELRPVTEKWVQGALEASKLDRAKLVAEGADPAAAMREFAEWVKAQAGKERRPVAVCFNATFDWQFINWYFLRFLGNNPFGISALDIKAYYMGVAGKTRWRETSKGRIDPIFRPARKHTHRALDDALEQAELFHKIYASAVRKGAGESAAK
jgi:ribonuclease T